MPQIVRIDRPPLAKELVHRRRPFATEVLPGNREPEYYADAFMKMFDGGAIDLRRAGRQAVRAQVPARRRMKREHGTEPWLPPQL